MRRLKKRRINVRSSAALALPNVGVIFYDHNKRTSWILRRFTLCSSTRCFFKGIRGDCVSEEYNTLPRNIIAANEAFSASTRACAITGGESPHKIDYLIPHPSLRALPSFRLNFLVRKTICWAKGLETESLKQIDRLALSIFINVDLSPMAM